MGRLNARVYIALIHHPIYNKKGEKITTTVTNLDLHDIARAGRTYSIEKYYVVNHLKSQQQLVARMRDYWTSGYGASYNENRHQAFSVLEIADSLDQVISLVSANNDREPELIATDARPYPGSISYREMRNRIYWADRPYILVFGTGWGLTETTLNRCQHMLEPVYGRGEFNHLSVRSAASIIMDRLLAGEWWDDG
ncbi:MAG: RNA methyltransferase [Bacillota bacterium]